MSGLKKGAISLILLLLSVHLTGCGDLVEIEDRDFVLAMGVSYDHNQYKVTFSLPDLGMLTDPPATKPGELLRTYEGKSLSEIEQSYNSRSENRLDYRHLQTIIIDSSVCLNQSAMEDLLIQIKENYDISHNVLVYFYESGIEELMGMEWIDCSIGEHLKKLSSNNYANGMEPTKIGALINNISNEQTLFIPSLLMQDKSVAVEGGIFFQKNQMIKQISQLESEIYFISLGKGTDYLLRISPEYLIQLKEVKAKTLYELTNSGPDIVMTISGYAKMLPGDGEADRKLKVIFNEYIKKSIELELTEYMKSEKIDYLNLYEKSSYKNRMIWQRYENRIPDFIDDVKIRVVVDIHYE